jgi:plasmid stabilization system protein ParE
VLEEFPRAGRVVPEFEVETFREVIFQNYRIVYAVLEGQVWILLVIHGAVNLPAQLRKRGIQPS